MAETTTSISMKRSWADIVKGSTSTPTSDADVPICTMLQPGKRGDYRCPCRGEVLVMLGHYGWIMTFDAIDHADLAKTAGRVYVHKRDVADGASLSQGCVVSFYLYADDQGLGAECCQVEKRAPWDFSADAEEFVPVSDIPYQTGESKVFTSLESLGGWNAGAAEFVPNPVVTATAWCTSNTQVAAGIATSTPNVLSINPAFFADDDSDDDSDDEFGADSVSGTSGGDADKDTCDSDKESSCNSSVDYTEHGGKIVWSDRMDAVAPHATSKCPRDEMGDESTSAGTSDSEAERSVRTPPGLRLPPGFRPPPGLELEV